MRSDLSAAATAALVSHMQNGYRTGHVWFGAGEGTAALVSHGDMATLVAISIGEGNRIQFGRYRFPVKGVYKLTLQQVVDRFGIVQNEDHSFTFSQAVDYFGGRGMSTFEKDFCANFSLIHPEAEVPDDILTGSARAYLKVGGAEEVISRLDGEALKALACVSTFDETAYDFYATSGDKGAIRRQAAERFPMFAAEIATKFLVKIAVDRKQSFTDALSASFGLNDAGELRLSPTLLRKFTHRHFSNRDVPIEVLIDTLSRLPIDYFPKTEREWEVFADMTDGIFRRLGEDVGVDIGTAAGASKGRWEEFALRLAKAYSTDRPPAGISEEERKAWKPQIDISRGAMRAAASAARDVVHSLRNIVILPAAANAAGSEVFVGSDHIRAATDIAAGIVYGEKSLTGIMELQRHWHTQAHNILNQIVEDADEDMEITDVAEDGWAPMCDVWTAPNGITIMPLTDPHDLKAEGARGADSDGVDGLSHCVGGYSAGCKAGESHILSLRRYEEYGVLKERISTVEFGPLEPGSNTLNQVQHRARKDAVPGREAQQALDWFKAMVDTGQIPLNHDGVLAYAAGIRRAAEDVEAYSGYDWRNEATIARVFDAWGYYLPKAFQKMSLEDLKTIEHVVALTDALAPSYASSYSMAEAV